MFSLRQQINGNPAGIILGIGDYQNFRGAGNRINANRAVDLPLGGGNIGIAGPDNLVDRCNGFGAIGQSGDSLRTANPPDFINTGNTGSRQHHRADKPVRRRNDNHPPLDPGNGRRHGIHQNG